jgi:tRNA(adenine34) deaminase
MMNNGLMDDLLAAARGAAQAGDVPVAAAIVAPDGTVVALETNRMVRDGNALHHAEILAINAALAITGMSRLDGYDLWVTLEPCAMCSGAIAHARLRRVYFAAYDVKAGAVESGIRYFDQPSCHHRPEIYGGLSEQAASIMLTEFFATKR